MSIFKLDFKCDEREPIDKLDCTVDLSNETGIELLVTLLNHISADNWTFSDVMELVSKGTYKHSEDEDYYEEITLTFIR